jgi:hypothetical protein
MNAAHSRRIFLLGLLAFACVGAAEPVPADAPQAFAAPLAARAPLVAIALAGTPPGNAFVWWLDRCSDGRL